MAADRGPSRVATPEPAAAQEQPQEQQEEPASTLPEVYKYMSKDQLEKFYSLTDPDAAASFLAEVLQLPEYRFDARSAIKLDYASYVLEFAKDMKFGPLRTSSVFNIAQNLLSACIVGASFTDTEATLKAQLLELCSPKPGLDSVQFSPDQIARIGQYFAKTLFRHYRLYAHVFSHEQDHTEYTAELLVETPVILPFDEAMPEAEWIAYNEEIKAKAEAERKAAEEAEVARIEAERQEAERREKEEAEAKRLAELAKKPSTLEEAIKHLVAVRLEEEKNILTEEYKAKEEALKKKLNELEAKAGELPPPSADGKARK